MLFGGIVVSAETRTSQKGNPYGRYTIEDYTGSHEFVLFGTAYQQGDPILKPNVYAFLTCTIQQRGKGQRWFQPKDIDTAEYEFVVQQVEVMDAAQKRLKQITLNIHIDKIQPDFVDDLATYCASHAGTTPLRLQVHDGTRQNLISFNAHPIRMDKDFYHWLKMQESDEVMTHQVE